MAGKIMRLYCPKKQQGIVVPLMAVILPVLLLVVGWALDFGHVFVNKTRLQNILDATALSAAITLNKDFAKDTAAATAKGKETFNLFKSGLGNNELAVMDGGALVFEYSKTLTPFTPGTNPPAFVRVISTGMLQVRPVLIRVFAQFGNDLPVPATATAGPVGQNCSSTPLLLCADMAALDTNCNDGACYGYTIGQIRSLAAVCNGNNNNCPPTSLGAGNYTLLDLDALQGANDIVNALAGQAGDLGYRNTCASGGAVQTNNHYAWGDVSHGIDDRFLLDSQQVQYALPGYLPSAYAQYQIEGLGNNKRVMAVTITDCRDIQNGNMAMPKVGVACVFLTEPSIQISSQAKIEFTGDSCQQPGIFDPANAMLNGPYKIVLFKSQGGADS